MHSLKKHLSVVLTLAMLFTSLCFFPLQSDLGTTADAAIVKNDSFAFYAPEAIYLYPSATSWKEATSAPFQYYIGNTVNTENIYSTPVVNPEKETTGKIYFATEEGMSNPTLTFKFLNKDGSYFAETVQSNITTQHHDNGTYHLFEITSGMSPVLNAETDGFFIEWCVSYTNASGERKSAFVYTYAYKPYTVPYGGAARTINNNNDPNHYAQQITWVSGVHSINTNVTNASSKLYPNFSAFTESAKKGFAAFLSSDNKGYSGSIQLSGITSPLDYSGLTVNNNATKMYAVFAANYASHDFFYPSKPTSASSTVMDWLTNAQAPGANTYNIPSIDYNFHEANAQSNVITSIVTGQEGHITIDTSRYSDLNQIPNLGVGLMATDIDNSVGGSWYVADATDVTYRNAGRFLGADNRDAHYNAYSAIIAAQGGASNDSTRQMEAQYISQGILYAGAWNKAIEKNIANKKYTVKGYVGTIDNNNDYSLAHVMVDLYAKQVNKANLRTIVNRAGSYLGTLGLKSTWGSYYYDGLSAQWQSFVNAYKRAYLALVQLDSDADFTALAGNLNAALEVLLSGTALRVYFDVNHDSVNPNLFIPGESNTTNGISFSWDNDVLSINGETLDNAYNANTPFTPSEGEYTYSASIIGGTFTGGGCLVIDAIDKQGTNVTNSLNQRYNFDIINSTRRVLSFEPANVEKIEATCLWVWKNNPNGVYTDRNVKIKIEKGSVATEYSPAGKIITGTSYGALPTPTRTGYTFEGWYTDTALTNKVSADSAVSSRMLYAKWIPNDYLVKFDNLFSIYEFSQKSSGMLVNNTNASITVENNSITIQNTNSSSTDIYCYTGVSSNFYNINVLPSTEYIFEYDLDTVVGSQMHLFFYNSAQSTSTWLRPLNRSYVYYGDNGEVIQRGSYTATDGGDFMWNYSSPNCKHVVLRFTTPADADIMSFRFGNSGDTTNHSVFSNVRLITADVYNETLEYSATEKLVSFADNTYGSLATVTKEGYTFGGWFTGKNGSGERITAESNIIPEHTVVYSHWLANSYTVKLDANTGTGNMGDINLTFDVSANLPTNTFTKEGYTFDGWSTTADGEKVFDDGDEIINLSSQNGAVVVLYALWKPISFNVVFNGNGSTSGSMDNAQVVFNSNVDLPTCLFEKTGYTFAGWALSPSTPAITERDYSTLRNQNGATVNLYALWSENTYTVNFNSNGGSGSTSQRTLGYDDDITLPVGIFSKIGHTQAGWATSATGEAIYSNGETVKGISAENNSQVTLYAVWQPNNYTVKLDSNGGTGNMADVPAQYGTYVTLPQNTFVKTGYHFMGWALEPNGSVVYADGNAVINLTNDNNTVVTLYAVWEINTYTVEFVYYNANGDITRNTINVTHGSVATPPASFVHYPRVKNSTTHHHVFTSWDSDISSVTESKTVVAEYSVTNEAHTINATTIDSTCVAEGRTTYSCVKCSYSYFEIIEKKSHTWSDPVYQTQPTCTEEGEIKQTCTSCGSTTLSPANPLGHSLQTVGASPASCSQEGSYEHKYCPRCKGYFPLSANNTSPMSLAIPRSEAIIEKLPHTPNGDATCTDAKICTVCNEIITPALGHSEKIRYENSTATCTQEGSFTEVKFCERCNTILYSINKTGKLPHNYITQDIPATCTTRGYTKYTCTACHESHNDNYTDLVPHTAGEWRVETPADCTNKGLEKHYCSECNNPFEEREIPANGHTSGEWRVTTPATCNEKGEETHYCSVCSVGYETREIDALGHNSGTWQEKIPAKCTEFGTEELICGRCNEVITSRGISPLDHITGEWVITTSAKCTTAGLKSLLCARCDAVLDTQVIPETGHTLSSAATCTTDQICTVCNEVIAEKFDHDWDNGVIVSNPTEDEDGCILFTCRNDSSHTKEETIPALTIIGLPSIPEDGTYDIDAAEGGFGGNIYDIITLGEGVSVNISSSDLSVLSLNPNGDMFAHKDGNVTLTITTTDGTREKQLPITVRTLKTISFDANGTITVRKAYNGDTVTPPTAEAFVDEGGFVNNFKAWTLNGTVVTDFTVNGDAYYVATYTLPCNYEEFDRIVPLFYQVTTEGNYDNMYQLILYKDDISAMRSDVIFYQQHRDTRDSSQQALLDTFTRNLSGLISNLYPNEGASIEIVCPANTIATGTNFDMKAIKNPIGTEIIDGVWTSSDTNVGFFSNGKFHAFSPGITTITVTTGELSASINITVTTTGASRVIMFDTLLTNTHYVIEDSYYIKTTTNLFWSPDLPLRFRLSTSGAYNEYVVYFNDVEVEPDTNGYYTIPAYSGDVLVRAAGVMGREDDGTRMSIWQLILNFFKKIKEFFDNLFS